MDKTWVRVSFERDCDDSVGTDSRVSSRLGPMKLKCCGGAPSTKEEMIAFKSGYLSSITSSPTEAGGYVEDMTGFGKDQAVESAIRRRNISPSRNVNSCSLQRPTGQNGRNMSSGLRTVYRRRAATKSTEHQRGTRKQRPVTHYRINLPPVLFSWPENFSWLLNPE